MYYGYIYKITIPTSNGDRYYYGKHKWNKYPQIDLRYWGSGRKISNWIKKYFGTNKRSNCLNIVQAEKIGLKQEIIIWCKTQEELDQKEYEIVSKEIKNPLCWNLDMGGKGGNRIKPFSSECIAARNKKYKNALGKFYWNNGEKEILQKDNPGVGWVKGRLPKCKWYNNGKKEIYTQTPPLGFTQGRINSVTPKKQVLCVELNKIFKSIDEATSYFHKNHSHISDCCNGKREFWCGYHWKYVN